LEGKERNAKGRKKKGGSIPERGFYEITKKKGKGIPAQRLITTGKIRKTGEGWDKGVDNMRAEMLGQRATAFTYLGENRVWSVVRVLGFGEITAKRKRR